VNWRLLYFTKFLGRSKSESSSDNCSTLTSTIAACEVHLPLNKNESGYMQQGLKEIIVVFARLMVLLGVIGV